MRWTVSLLALLALYQLADVDGYRLHNDEGEGHAEEPAAHRRNRVDGEHHMKGDHHRRRHGRRHVRHRDVRVPEPERVMGEKAEEEGIVKVDFPDAEKVRREEKLNLVKRLLREEEEQKDLKRSKRKKMFMSLEDDEDVGAMRARQEETKGAGSAEMNFRVLDDDEAEGVRADEVRKEERKKLFLEMKSDEEGDSNEDDVNEDLDVKADEAKAEEKKKLFLDFKDNREEIDDEDRLAGLEAEEAKEEVNKGGDNIADKLLAKFKGGDDEKKTTKKDVGSGSAENKKGDGGGGSDKMPKIMKPPGVDKCEDKSEDACRAFEPMCALFPKRAYIFCRKTCKKCKEDDPVGLELQAEIPELKGKVVMKQCAPRSTMFLAACFAKDQKVVQASKEYGLEVHDYANIEKGGSVCTDVGPEFNPFNVLHGGPMTTMKKTGDLGNVKFLDKPPDAWPKEKDDMKCKDDEIGAYAMYNHVDLYDLYSVPAYKPIVIHEKKDDLGTSEKKDDGNSGPGIACGILKCSEALKKEMQGKKKQGGGDKGSGEAKKSGEKKEGMEKDKKSGEKKDDEAGGGGKDGEKNPLEVAQDSKTVTEAL